MNPVVPVDEDSLRLLTEALDSVIMEDGSRTGEFSLHRLLEFWSGYDETQLTQVDEDVFVYEGVLLHPNDIIRALVNEIRNLRGNN